MRDSVLFYRSFWEAVKELPPEPFKESVKAIMEYGLNEKEPETSGIEKTVYHMAKPQIDANNRRYQNGTKGGRPVTEKEPDHNQAITKEEPNNNLNITKQEPKDKDKVKEKDKVKDNNKIFVPPCAGDIEEYCTQNGYKINAETFVDFYTSKGWLVGKSKMKDWKSAVRNWNRSQRPEVTAKAKPKNGFHNLEEHGYDYDKLVWDLMNSGTQAPPDK